MSAAADAISWVRRDAGDAGPCLVHPQSGADYFTAAQAIIKAAQIAALPETRRRPPMVCCQPWLTGRTCSRRPRAAV